MSEAKQIGTSGRVYSGRLSGWLFQQIYRRAGYSRRGVAAFFKRKALTEGAGFAVDSESGLRGVERRTEIPDRYVRWLQELVSPPVFFKHLGNLGREFPSDPSTLPAAKEDL